MEKDKIDRINFLARKSKSEGLSEEEKREQQELRKQYIADFKRSFAHTLDQVVIMDPEGNKTRIKKKGSDNLPQ